jgi:hypothetical protein
MVTKQHLQNMLDETIEELEKPNAAMQGNRFRQLIHHRANLEMKLRDLEESKPEPEKQVLSDEEQYHADEEWFDACSYRPVFHCMEESQ